MIKNILTYTLRKIMRCYWNNHDAKIPRIELQDKHLINSKVLLNRETLLYLLPKDGIVAEIGVDEGCFSKQILDINNPHKLYLIDAWNSTRYNIDKKQKVYHKFNDLILDKKLTILEGFSTEVVKTLKDDYFDWIYIDSDHSYKTTYAELLAYSEKMKPGGIIAGHDFIVGNWNGVVRYGVIEAVYEFCVKHNWELLYLTMEQGENPSYAIRKIDT